MRPELPSQLAAPDGLNVKLHDFSYSPLDRPSEQIRLIRIHHSAEIGFPVVCDIDHYDLDNCPPYAAVSYVWGKPLPLHDIALNGWRNQVHYNCWVALWQMRYHRLWEYIWIDSLCINQKDNHEKAHQVRLMGRIYNSAVCVAASLGDGVDFGKLAKGLRDERENANQVSDMPKVDGVLPGRASGLLLANASFMNQLARTTYFDRLWVVQELVLAKDIMIFCGRQHLDWSELVRTIGCWDPAYVLGNHKRIQNLIDHRMQGTVAQHGNGNTGDLVDCLLMYGDGLCTNLRDKIYSLLALIWADSAEESRLPIDYEKPLFGVLVDFVDLLGRADMDWEDDLGIDKMATTIERLVKWFKLRWSDPEVQAFLHHRLDNVQDALGAVSGASARTQVRAIDCEIIRSCHLCSEPCNGPFIAESASIIGGFWDFVAAAGLQFAGFSTADLKLVCLGKSAVLLASPNVRPGDILLKTAIPRLGNPLLIVRRQGGDCHLVGKAIQLDAASAFWASQCNCSDDFDVVEQDAIQRIRLQPRDLLALALLRQRVSESLMGPVTAPKRAAR